MSIIRINDIAARIHHDMVTFEGNGYTQGDDRWGGNYGGVRTLELYGRKYSYRPGDRDCSSSDIQAWQIALQGTKYEGVLDDATYTGDMEYVFTKSGLFYSDLSPAKRGDLYLAETTAYKGGHTAMCQDGGDDGVFGYDCLSEFNRNELHSAFGGEPGDQDGYESVFRDYYDYPWRTVLHYNGLADFDPNPKHIVPDLGKDAVYRMLNPYSGTHHFTTSRKEAQSLSDAGWSDEGLAWRSASKGAKVRRLYNPHNGLHLLTVDDTEAVELVGTGWQYEGVAMFSGGDRKVYRVYNRHSGEHMYTTSTAERDALVAAGWKAEGDPMRGQS